LSAGLDMPPGVGSAVGEGIAIVAIAEAVLTHEAGVWEFAVRERRRIADYWRGLVAGNPALWNGDMLVGFEPAVAGGRLSLRLRSTDFASFVAWRDWGFADPTAWNCFGTPVMMSADGAILYGVMAAHTLNAGLAYPPSGSLEARDIGPGGRIDLAGSMATEVREETGLDLGEARAGGLLAVFEARRLSVARLYRFDQPADALVARIEAFVGTEARPELAGIVALRAAGDLDRPMPAYARALARHVLGV
jgi:hypothetical protein